MQGIHSRASIRLARRPDDPAWHRTCTRSLTQPRPLNGPMRMNRMTRERGRGCSDQSPCHPDDQTNIFPCNLRPGPTGSSLDTFYRTPLLSHLASHLTYWILFARHHHITRPMTPALGSSISLSCIAACYVSQPVAFIKDVRRNANASSRLSFHFFLFILSSQRVIIISIHLHHILA